MEVEPLRDEEKIVEIRKILRARRTGRRDEALFVLGINTALRISDLLALHVGDVLDADGNIGSEVELREKKTGKAKCFPLNQAIQDVLSDYLTALRNRGPVRRSSPLFPSRQGGMALSRWRAREILARAGEAVGLNHVGTHSLRKTLGYHVYNRTGGNLGLVQKLLNHSYSSDTLRYIGIDREQMDDTYLKLNLGVM